MVESFFDLKKMLLRADESNREKDQELGRCVKGIIFLGTPHQGSSMADLGDTMRKIARAVGFDTAKQNIKTLEIDSDSLQECQRRFVLLRKRRIDLDICIFQEGRGMTGAGYLNLGEKVVVIFDMIFSLS